MRMLREIFGKFSSLLPITRSAEELEIAHFMSAAARDRHDVVELHEAMSYSADSAGTVLMREDPVDLGDRNDITVLTQTRTSRLCDSAPKFSDPLRVLSAPVTAALAFYLWLSGAVGAFSRCESLKVFGLKTSLTESRTLYALSVAHRARNGMTVPARLTGPVVRFTRRLGELSLFDRRPHSILLKGVL